jgi:hypothetical protein
VAVSESELLREFCLPERGLVSVRELGFGGDISFAWEEFTFGGEQRFWKEFSSFQGCWHHQDNRRAILYRPHHRRAQTAEEAMALWRRPPLLIVHWGCRHFRRSGRVHRCHLTRIPM